MNPSKRQVKCLECKELSDADEAVCKHCFDDNVDSAYDNGFSDGKAEGQKEGHKEGHDEGYNEGYADAIKKVRDAIDKVE